MSDMPAKETYLYGQLFALAKEQDDALDALAARKLGMWGRARLQARTKRMQKVAFEIMVAKVKGGLNMDQVADAFRADIESCARTWPNLTDGQLSYVRGIARMI
ncbi:MAG TPA: hypothetical protein VGO34_11310 [Alphaproteobacteria bacterium]|jgi:hypothetical protein